MNQRVADLRDCALRSRRGTDPEAERLRTESFAQTKGEPAVIREAKAFAHFCRNRTVVIQDGELIVGSQSCMAHDPEDHTAPRIFDRRTWLSPWPVTEDVQVLFREGLLSGAGNHTTMDYERILAVGFEGLIDQIDRRIGRLTPDGQEADAKRQFLEALRTVAEGYIAFCRRYAEQAQALARETEDETRRRELETMADNCLRVPAKPPASFWEACQAVWFCFFFLPDAPGRVDQYLYPFYKKEVEQNTLTPDFARELVSCLWIKYFEFAGAQAGVSAHQHLTLGGVKADGNDASNEVTALCLDVTEDLRLHRPQVGLRWNRNTPPGLLERAIRVLRTHSGNPDFCSDEQIMPALEKIGVRTEDARDFSLSGCHEVIVTGKAQMGSVEGFINMPKMLRLMLGLEPALGPGADLEAIDGDEALWDALEETMAFAAEGAHRAAVARDREAAEEPGGNLAASLVVSDCIENARGYTQGGARYNHCNWDVIGTANLADSLEAIRRLVFVEEALTLRELAEALRANWRDREALRQRILNTFLHFGNDHDKVDGTAGRIIETFADVFSRHKPFRGGEYILGTTAGGENMHIEFGRVTGATPDGRADGETMADSLGAVQGRDREGVTALMNSVAKLPHRLLPTATTLNVKLDPRLLTGDSGVEKIAALIQGHFLNGGQQCQFNLVNREMLLEAKRCPEQHGDLMVRVAGYSAPFTALWEDLQDEIIARTEHGV
ncbi:MAG: pyruvate formate lyase family protein [Candidatus Latescibacteria bacterium]|jgi:formate C-acetyltransferase|nr:pyruvate formate lyase family protein [Candidatus Latescibacterota bacterium]